MENITVTISLVTAGIWWLFSFLIWRRDGSRSLDYYNILCICRYKYTISVIQADESWYDYNGCLYTLLRHIICISSMLTAKYCMPFMTVFHTNDPPPAAFTRQELWHLQARGWRLSVHTSCCWLALSAVRCALG